MQQNAKTSLTFGPIPSRRLGHSLGINHIPPKVCSFGCVYCQVGHTTHMRAERQAFYSPQDILSEVKSKLAKLRAAGEPVDYLSFVPDGEPTLDANLGKEIDLLKPLGYRIAVITNASLIWREDVRRDLMKADWVSLKIDSLNEKEWHRVDRAHKKLQLQDILDGMLEFSRRFTGELVTETMLVKGLNDSTENAEKIGRFLARLQPAKAYLLVPTRPPAEKDVQPPDEHVLNAFYQTVKRHFENVRYQMQYEGNTFASSGKVEEDILGITAVHPMRKDAVENYLAKTGADWSKVQKLIDQHLLLETTYDGHVFYVRRFSRKGSAKRKAVLEK